MTSAKPVLGELSHVGEVADNEPNTIEKKSFVSNISDCCKDTKINRALLPLKFSLFTFFAAGAVIAPFLQLYFLQRGLTIAQLASIYSLTPAVHFLGPSISGVIADKLGRSKPVLVANLILVFISINGMLFIPTLTNCSKKDTNVTCNSTSVIVPNLPSCESSNFTRFYNCIFEHEKSDSFVELDSEHSHGACTASDMYSNTTVFELQIEAISFKQNESETCVHNISLPPANSSPQWCSETATQNCTLNCRIGYDIRGTTREECDETTQETAAIVYAMCFLLMLVFITVMSNCYRILDVTSMAMVKVHNSDFGRQRFWSIVSGVLVSPLSGYLVTLTTPKDGPDNYKTAFYLFDAMLLLTFLAIWKLDVQVVQPGKKMWKKTLRLLEKPDVLAFSFALLALGTSWAFNKNFAAVFLKKNGGSSLLISLLFTVNGLTGLPFLVTSNWWLKKLGSTNLLLLAFISYTTLGVLYYFLYYPWLALVYELHSVFTYHLLWVAVVRHSHEIAPEGLTATVIASAGAMHYGIGKGTGSIIGFAMDIDEGRSAYLYMACLCGTSFVLYSTFLHFWYRYSQNKTEGENVSLRNCEKLSSL